MKKKTDKLKVIKDLISGKRSITSILPPRSFIVTANTSENEYKVTGPDIEPLILDEQQYLLFKAGLREIDVVFELFFCDYSQKQDEPQKQLPAPQKQIEYSVSDNKTDYSPETTTDKQIQSEPVKVGKKAKKKPVKIKQTVIEMKQSGLVSEYGTTWKASFSKF